MVVSKSRGLRVDGLGFFLISAEERTSKMRGARGMYDPVARERRRSDRIKKKRRGKYCAVGISLDWELVVFTARSVLVGHT